MNAIHASRALARDIGRRGTMAPRVCASVAAVAVSSFLVTSGSEARPSAQRQGPMTLEAVAEIGCGSCGDARLLSNVLGVTVATGGDILVLDLTRPKVRVFGPRGQRVGTAVSEGREPGQAVLPIAVMETGAELTLVDMALRRVTVYDSAWNYLRHRPLPETPVAVAYRPPHGHLYYATVNYAETPLMMQVWRLGLEGGEPTLVFTTPADGFPRDRAGEPASFFAFAMTPSGGFVLGEGEFAYRIRVFDGSGRLEREIARDVPRATMSEEDRERALDRRRLALRRISSVARSEGGSPGIAEEIALELNHFSAAALRYDDRGRLWVKTDRGGPRETVFDLFGPDGALLGEARVQGAMGTFDVRGSTLAGLAFTEDDVPVIRVYRVGELR